MVKRIFLPFLLLLLFSGCEIFMAPDHSNPYDSEYAGEGTGYNLRMTASSGQINLSWSRSQDGDFTRYRIITSPVRMDIKAAVLDPANYAAPASVSTLTTLTVITTTNYSFASAPYTGLNHFAVIYESASSDAGSPPKASNIVTYEQ